LGRAAVIVATCADYKKELTHYLLILQTEKLQLHVSSHFPVSTFFRLHKYYYGAGAVTLTVAPLGVVCGCAAVPPSPPPPASAPTAITPNAIHHQLIFFSSDFASTTGCSSVAVTAATGSAGDVDTGTTATDKGENE
jgi:hypothetical protein